MFSKTDGGSSDTIRLFDALIENFPDMIHSVDAKGDIVYFNRTATALLGYTGDELGAMNIRNLYPPEIMDAVEKGFREVKQAGEKRVESLFMAKDGTRIPVELRTFVIRDAQGAFVTTFTVSRDMRQLKELQDHLIHASRLAAIGELAAGVVHDLNNPLTAVILASSFLKQTASNPNTSPGELREQVSLCCETVDESAATMESLTTRLRDFSRGVKERHTAVDLFDPVCDALLILAHRIRNGQVHVRCSVVKAKHWTSGDRNQIQQLFLNLFANACDAMAQSAVRELTIDIVPDTLDGNPAWRCAVGDTGEGIPHELQEKVFQAFFTTKPRGQGTGLGLSITRSILKEHNGVISLVSGKGQGTTFFISLPAHTPPGLDQCS